MKIKKWIAILLLVVLTINLFTACKSAVPEEQASADAVVENEEQQEQQPQDRPEVNNGEAHITIDETDTPKEEEQEEEEEESLPEDTDPYEVPISKTEATTEDGVKYYLENKLKIVSYNIRCVSDPNGNSIEERSPRLEEVIKKYDPDIMGFQEFTTPWEMPADFSFSDDYDYIVKYRSTSNLEATPVFWKRSKFKLLDSGMYWLSETPDTESKGWGADHYRIVTWVKLEIRQTGKVVYFCSTHFDFTDAPQVNSAQMTIDRAKQVHNNAPTIVVGDFNMTNQSKGYAKMTEFFTDVNLKKDPTMTFTGYGEPRSLIDFIFVTGKSIKPTAYNVMNEKPQGNFVSDHFGVYSEVIIL